MENQNTPTIIMTSPSKQRGVVDYVFMGVFAVGGYFGVRYLWRKYQANQQNDAAGGDINIQAAMEIHQAIDGAGTSEKVLFTVANRISDWKAVSEAYRKLYNTNMTDDLKGDLSASDFQKFMNLYNLGQKNSDGTPKASKNTLAKGLLVVAERDVYVRKTPVYQKVLTGAMKAIDWLNVFKTNAVALAPAGNVIGVSTGVYSDDVNSPSGTRFIEVQVIVMDETKKHELVKMWVASSQVKTMKNKPADWMDQYKGKITIINKTIYQSALSGLSVSPTNIQIITNSNEVGVYDTNFVLKTFARKKDLILGYKIADQKYGKANMVAYQTIDGIIRNSFKEQVTEVTELS
jgi:hypothetical protein